MKIIVFLLFWCLFLLFASSALNGQQSDPLFQMGDLLYKGAFRIPADTYGISSMNFSEGPIAYNPENHSLYVVGHDHQQAIAEFSIPGLDTGSISNLNMATNLQPFEQHLGNVNCTNSQNINQIGGMMLIDGKLYVNAYEYYDADGNVTHTTMVLEQPGQLSTTEVRGFFSYEGGAGHTAGWISEVPIAWRNVFGGSHITGFSSGIPIISRCSVGPSAFCFTPLSEADSCNTGVIPTNRLLDFSLDEPLHDDLSNSTGLNDIWTHLSRATFGMIVPNTRTYLTIGYSGGHESGVCYKCTQDNGNTCGGYCAPEADDYDQYYWLWDLDDLTAVHQGTMQASDVRPYDYGPFHTPYENSTKQIGGGTYDPISNTLYLAIQRADSEQGIYANPPIIVAYELSATICECCTTSIELSSPDIYDNMNIYATDYIISDAVIPDSFQIMWRSGNYIGLNSPFELGNSAVLELSIGDCE